MPVEVAIVCRPRSHQTFRHAVLLTTVSVLAMVLGGGAAQARPLGGGASAAMPATTYASDAANVAAQQAAAMAKQSQSALIRATQAIRSLQAVQSAARNAAASAQRSATLPQVVVPNGLTSGGLQVAPGAVPGSSRWSGADLPTEATTSGRVNVNINQTAPRAILNWQTFNVGAATTVNFNQQGNANWTALNRVTGNLGPSQILGSINAPGQVLVINQNGIIFGGASQINVGSLIASTANITDNQFTVQGIYSTQRGRNYLPSFTGAGGKIIVENGALITTTAPSTVTAGGGFVALFGTEVSNAGSIITPKGQALLAAGDDFILRPGFGTTANQSSTVRGTEVAPLLYAGSSSGTVTNAGVIFAQRGDITLAGHTIVQDGALVSTTSVSQRGTIHLLNAASDAKGSVTLTGNSLALILPELDSADTALNSQRDGLITDSAAQNAVRAQFFLGQFDNLSRLADRQDQSRVEIVTGGTVNFRNGSLTMAQGGQVAVSAGRRVFTETGSTIDVSGVQGVILPMSSNEFSVNIQGNELRDSPQNRDSGALFNKNVRIDARDLVLVPAGTGGYAADRYYTAGGLLEVGGYLSNTGHTIGEWTAVGGSITLAAPEVVAQQGATFNLSGGSVQFQGGYLPQTNLLGSDGRIYDINTAPSYLSYSAVVNGFMVLHKQGGKVDPKLTEIYVNPLGRGAARWQDGYTVGRDAGRLILTTPTLIFDGSIIADVTNGERQMDARPAGATDGYKLAQKSVALAGALELAQYTTYSSTSGGVTRTTVVETPVAASIMIGRGATRQPGSEEAIGAEFVGKADLNADRLSSFGLGRLVLDATQNVTVAAPLTLAKGGSLRIMTADADFKADVTARGGSIIATNIASDGISAYRDKAGRASITVAPGVRLDTRGLWVNALLDPTANLSDLALIDGGSVTLRSTGNVTLSKGARIDASSGGAILSDGKTKGGVGGDVTLNAGYTTGIPSIAGNDGALTLDGDIASYGFVRGGRLSLSHGGVVVINDSAFDLGTSMDVGRILPADVILTEDVIWPANRPLPADVVIAIQKTVPEGVLANDLQIKADYANPTLVTADLVVQPKGFIGGTFGSYYFLLPGGGSSYISLNQGGFIPKGSRLSDGIVFMAGLVTVSGGALDLGVVKTNYAQGSVAPVPYTFRAGDRLKQNSLLSVPIKFAPLDTMHLSFDRLSGGFSAYDIRGDAGLFVGNDAVVQPAMPVFRFTEASYQIAAGGDPYQALERYQPPVYNENPLTAKLTQRAGVDLTFASAALVDVGKGASIMVDPGHSVSLVSNRQITVDGTITAPGGAISLLDAYSYSPDFGLVRQSGPGTTSMWIGENAVLDVSARAYIAEGLRGRRYGVVPTGGTITVARVPGKEASTFLANAADAFIVIRPGALLDASGTSATVDILGSDGVATTTRPVTVASDGGTISLRSYDGIYAEGVLRATAGGAGASGGKLDIVLESPYYSSPPSSPPPSNLMVGRVLYIGQDAVPRALAADLRAGQVDETLALGRGGISARQIQAGGFDIVSLWGRTAIAFDGNVALSAGRSITLSKGAIYNTVADGNVALNAPYVLLDGQTTPVIPDYNTVASTLPASLTGIVGGTFSINAGLIDVGNTVAVRFKNTGLTSATDLRFLASSDVPSSGLPTTRLSGAGDLTLTAAQLYPASGAIVEVSAQDLLSTISPGGALPAMPYSVFGSITLRAPTVRQGGVLRAPLGSIALGQKDSTLSNTVTELLPGSVTSVSAAGLVIPYGGTVDGVSYKVDGASPVTPNLITGRLSGDTAAPTQGITLNGTQVLGREGARIDLSGGGTLLGAAFVSGRGGSVDVLTTALANANPVNRYSAAGNAVFAIVPGVNIAPVAGGYASRWTGAGPGIGQQVTIPEGVPGLSAGTYTLLPANYALLPGAYRVELGATTVDALAQPIALPNHSYLTAGVRGIAGTAIRSELLTQLIVTPGAAVRTYAQYQEQGYDAFQLTKAATFNMLRPLLPRDGKFLTVNLSTLTPGSAQILSALEFGSSADFMPATGGYGGTLVLTGQKLLSITGPGSVTQRSDSVTPVTAGAINAIGAPNVYIGRAPIDGVGMSIAFGPNYTGNSYMRDAVTLERGAVLTGSQVALAGLSVTVEEGAGIDTIGRGVFAPGSATTGYSFGGRDTEASDVSFILVSNSKQLLSSPAASGNGRITISNGALFHSEGTVGIWTSGKLEFGGMPDFGTSRLILSLPSINIGTDAALAAAATNRILPGGLNLGQDFLGRLLSGQPATGIPALQELVLTASQSVNFYGSVALTTGRAGAGLGTLVLNSPAIYGYGTAQDVASLSVDRLVWNGVRSFIVESNGTYTAISAPPGATIAGGPGSGLGRFTVDAREIVLGYPRDLQPYPDGRSRFDRLMLGFSNVTFNASDRVISNRIGSLSVYAQGPSPDAKYKPETYQGIGGNLTLVTPLLTGEAGSAFDYRAGGMLTVTAPAETTSAAAATSALGAQISLTAGGNVLVDSTVVLPSGRLALTAAGDIVLGDRAQLRLSGQAISFFDVTKNSWGGDVELESTHGSITQSSGSVIDISANGNDAGKLTLTATDASAGRVWLGGSVKGGGGQGFKGGSVDVRAQLIGNDPANLNRDFAELNIALSAAGFTESRSFDLKQGSLVVGHELKAHSVAVSIDGGSLIVNGTIDASGQRTGSIRLAARDNLTVNGVLDAHGTVLRVDSDGAAIGAANTAEVELSARRGMLTLAPGTVIDLRAADQVARGKLTLNAPRLGSTGASATGPGAPTEATGNDIAINAGGPLAIRGARQIVLNAYASYANLPYQNNDATTNTQVVTQGFLDLVDRDSVVFMNAALANGGLQGRLAGLTAYGGAFHLRPGVEIVSLKPDGNLIVSGDLDLAGYRYGPQADRNPASATYGAGEPIAFTLRAGGNLTINGSISDGFGPGKPATPGAYTGKIAAGTDPAINLGTVYDSDYFAGFNCYYNAVSIYLTEDWVFPTDAFYQSLGYMNDSQYKYYYPGDTIPAGTQFDAVGFYIKSGDLAPALATGLTPAVPPIPAGSAPAPALANGSLSASIRLVAGADLTAAETRTLLARSALAGGGNILLSDYHTYPVPDYRAVVNVPVASSIRTGMGDLDLLAGGDFSQSSIYNISTRGWGDAAPADLYVRVQGSLSGWGYGENSGSPDRWLNQGTLAFNDGFTGFGALGGGNVTLQVGKDAGALIPTTNGYDTFSVRDTALMVGAAGGGDVVLEIGGRLNPNVEKGYTRSNDHNGVFSNLRGDLTINAGAIGYVPLRYGGSEINDPRAPEPGRPIGLLGLPVGGINVTPGDGNVALRTRGDLVLADVLKPKVVGQWRATTAIELFSAGGNLLPYDAASITALDTGSADDRYPGRPVPAIFSATAASGSIYYSGDQDSSIIIRLAPSPRGHLELLAQDSIYAAAGTDDYVQQLYKPARFVVTGADADPVVFGDAARMHEGDFNPIRIYAVNGDLVNVALGATIVDQPVSNGPTVTYYGGAKAAKIMAGRDIVNFGRTPLPYHSEIEPSFILNTHADDVSVVSAGRDMYYTNVQIAGPGTLEISAGRNLYQGEQGNIISIGPVASGDTRPGATIVMQAGVGANGPDYARIAALYLDPANLAVTGVPLADQQGKVAKTYEKELADWLKRRYGFEGPTEQMRAYFATLAPEQQHIFLRQVYFAELREGGREYNNPASPRYGSYLRGRDAIAALFPETDVNGQAITRPGDITMFGGSGVRTLFGGDVQVLTPGGRTIVGVEGQVPPASAGLSTQGSGDIQVYSRGSILLGLSRIMTTFGGDVLAWSAEGDINAGRGSKTTIVYTPLKRVYDNYGNVALSPSVPSSGAGIATLSPIPGIAAGDIDLIAPLGTIDAGEAGIRVSGNINLAALQIVNAANIQVQGTTTGIQTVQGPPTAVLTAASNSTAATQQTAAPAQSNGGGQPSVVIVEVLGYGGGDDGPRNGNEDDRRKNPGRQSYDSNGMFRVLGNGKFTREETKDLTEEERTKLSQIN